MAGSMTDAPITDARPSILPADLAATLFAQARLVSLAAGQVLFQAGDPCNGCYQTIEGLLKVTLDLASGRERILAVLGPGALVGDPAAAANGGAQR